VNLAADCSRCVGLCCVAPGFAASSDFAFAKPAGVACRHLAADASCSIHDRLVPSGMPGCVAYDCFGAGQRVVALFGGGGRSARMLSAYETVRQLHELLWYLTDALSRAAAAPVHGELAAARSAIEVAVVGGPSSIEATDPAAHRATVGPLLRRASALARAATRSAGSPGLDGASPDRPSPDHGSPDHRAAAGRDPAARDLAGRDVAGRDLRDLAGRDLVGRDLAGRDLAGADLSTALLIGADLRGADLRWADLLGTDLRGAELGGADLAGALYLTRSQVGSARGSSTTRLPDRLPHPAHWLAAGAPAP
jgi:Pentapeptide repeats (8 copies)